MAFTPLNQKTVRKSKFRLYQQLTKQLLYLFTKKIFKKNIFFVNQKKNKLTTFGRYLNTKQIIKHFYCNIFEKSVQTFISKFNFIRRKMNHLSKLLHLLSGLELENLQRRLTSSTQKSIQLEKKYVIAHEIAKQGRIQFNQDNIIGLTSSKQGRIQREQDNIIGLTSSKQGPTQAIITQPSLTQQAQVLAELFAIGQESDSSFEQSDPDIGLRESSCYEIPKEIIHLLNIDFDSLRLKLGPIEKKTIKKPPITKHKSLTLDLFIEKFIHNVYISSVDVAVTNNLQSNDFLQFETYVKNTVNSKLFLSYLEIDLVIHKNYRHLSILEVKTIRRKIVKIFSKRGFPKKVVRDSHSVQNVKLQKYLEDKKFVTFDREYRHSFLIRGLSGISLLSSIYDIFSCYLEDII